MLHSLITVITFWTSIKFHCQILKSFGFIVESLFTFVIKLSYKWNQNKIGVAYSFLFQANEVKVLSLSLSLYISYYCCALSFVMTRFQTQNGKLLITIINYILDTFLFQKSKGPQMHSSGHEWWMHGWPLASQGNHTPFSAGWRWAGSFFSPWAVSWLHSNVWYWLGSRWATNYSWLAKPAKNCGCLQKRIHPWIWKSQQTYNCYRMHDLQTHQSHC